MEASQLPPAHPGLDCHFYIRFYMPDSLLWAFLCNLGFSSFTVGELQARIRLLYSRLRSSDLIWRSVSFCTPPTTFLHTWFQECAPHRMLHCSWWLLTCFFRVIVAFKMPILSCSKLTSHYKCVRCHILGEITLEFDFIHLPGMNN